MTQSTEQERAILYKGFCEWCKTVPHLDLDPRLHTHGGRIEDGGYIADTATAKAFAAWKAARRAPVVSSRPTVDQVSDAIGYHSSGWDCANPDELIDVVLRLSAAPQPPEAGLMSEKRTTKPEAAPVELPEPVYTMRVRGRMHDYTPTLSAFDLADGEHNLYTEQQVRQLLAAHGIQEQST